MDLSANEPATTTPHRALGPEAALVFATVLFGVSVRANSPASGLAVALAIGLAATAFVRRTAVPLPSERPDQSGRRLFGAILIFSILGIAGWAPSTIGETSSFLERTPGIVWGILAVLVFVRARLVVSRTLALAVTSSALIVTLVVGLLHIGAVQGVGRDVYFLHSAAADAISQGLNPYTDAVEVPNGSPTAEPGDTIVGYPYPPVTALAYAVGEWSLSDARYTSLLSWLIVLGVVGARATASRRRESLYVLLLLASIPGWPLILRGGWTEPVSLLLLVLAIVSWPRPHRSGLSLGLGLASKQYFVVAAPLALFHRDQAWQRRLAMTAGMVVVTIGVALVADFGAFWSAAVEFHMATPPRFDSSNLIGSLGTVGITWAPPAFLGLAAGLLVATLVGRRSRSAESFSLGLVLVLAVSFFFSTQAFANYWFLVTGICCVALLPLDERGARRAPALDGSQPNLQQHPAP